MRFENKETTLKSNIEILFSRYMEVGSSNRDKLRGFCNQTLVSGFRKSQRK